MKKAHISMTVRYGIPLRRMSIVTELQVLFIIRRYSKEREVICNAGEA